MNHIQKALAVVLMLQGLSLEAGATCTAGGSAGTPVPETTPTSAFVIHNDGTATHNLTGLMWQRCMLGGTNPGLSTCNSGSPLLTWQGTLLASARDTTAGYTDWRLPNLKELESIVELCGNSPNLNKTVFPFLPTLIQFWSSSTYAPNPTEAWTIRLYSNDVQLMSKTNQTYAFLVRGGRPVSAYDAQSKFRCSLDFDDDGRTDALTDGLLLVRALFGLTGTAVTGGTIGAGATRTDWADVRTFLNQYCGTSLAP